ncbi:MAG: hypothetical protein LBL97_07000 [Prevotellaceae bacterium]|jgi:hypothetical protein|nr:hypothetical protein [Prevotellaceae bacterium]
MLHFVGKLTQKPSIVVLLGEISLRNFYRKDNMFFGFSLSVGEEPPDSQSPIEDFYFLSANDWEIGKMELSLRPSNSIFCFLLRSGEHIMRFGNRTDV